MQKSMPAKVEVLYKVRSARIQDVQAGITLAGKDTDSGLADKQNEGSFPIDFNPSDPLIDIFYRATNENGIGNVIDIVNTIVRVALSGALTDVALTFNVTDPGNSQTFKIGDVLEIEDELMVISAVTPGSPTIITVEERGVHGTVAVSHIDTTNVLLMKYTVPHNTITVKGIVDTALPGPPSAFLLSNPSGAEGNGIEFQTELPTTGSRSITWLQIMLRKSGVNLVTNGDFAADSDWTKGTGWTISGGTASKSAGSASDLEQNQAVTNGTSYQIKFTVSGRTAGTVFVRVAGTAGVSRSTNAAFVETVKAGAGAEPKLEFVADSSFDGSIDDVTVLQTWGDDVRDTTGLGVIQDSGADGAITQGGLTLVTSETLDTGHAGKTIYTHEGIDVTNGEVTFGTTRPIVSAVDIGGGEWEITVADEHAFRLRNGKDGAAGVVNFIVADNWANLSVPTYLAGLITRPLSITPGDPQSLSNFYDFLKTADTVFARARFANFNGAGKWMYWDGSVGDIDKTKAVTFTPVQMDAQLAIDTTSFAAAVDDSGGGGTPFVHQEATWLDNEVPFALVGEVVASDTHTGANNNANLIDTTFGAFITDKVLVGDLVKNTTDGSEGLVVTVVSETELDAPLSGGTDNDWDTGDSFQVIRSTRLERSPLLAFNKAASGKLTIGRRLANADGDMIFWCDDDGSSDAAKFTWSIRSTEVDIATLEKYGMTLIGGGFGSTRGGNFIQLNRNSTSGSEAPGWIHFQDKSNKRRPVWVDNSGDLKIHSPSGSDGNIPTNANEGGGTIVGTQGSVRALKTFLDYIVRPNFALQKILGAKVYPFTYKSGSCHNSVFVGPIADEFPEVMMDRNTCFSPISAFGYTTLAMQAMHKKTRRTNIALGLVIILMLLQWIF